jgi:hypothetical protein
VPSIGKSDIMGDDGDGSFCWNDFPGTERIWEGVVEAEGVVELRRGRMDSVDAGCGGFGRGADGFGGVGRSGRAVCVEREKVDDKVVLYCSSRRDLKGIVGEVSGILQGDAPGVVVDVFGEVTDAAGDCAILGDRP